MLVERCYKCHSAQSEKLKGGLHLDSRAGMHKGGDTRPAIAPGDPEKSLLIEAIRYGNPDLQMPPKGKLPDAQIADFVTWVKDGAVWPENAETNTIARQQTFDLEKRRREHWAWQPIKRPSLPKVTNAKWPAQPPDQFILPKFEKKNLQPAARVDRRTFIRRLYFDLIGLPPPANDVENYLRDSSADADAKLVNRLLASPQFGERWARHWLDLVRYSETLGHEFDYPNHNAWRYRDYVIRAFNADVPYNQFVTEHIAGDLLESPRRHPTEHFNESIIGTTFFWLGQRDHSPVDVRLHEAEVIDNQIDVLSKTFLGITVACARCHDHKFDAIGTRDYYSLYGVLGSSRYAQRAVDSPERIASAMKKLAAAKARIREAAAEFWTERIQQLSDFVLATNVVPSSATPPSRSNNEHIFADFTQCGFDGWFVDGEAFGAKPAVAGDFMIGNSNRPMASLFAVPVAHSAALSRRLQGALRSPTFIVTNRYIHILAAGRESRINVPIDNFTMIREPIYGGLKKVLNSDELKWITVDVDMWKGHKAFIEFSDVSTPDPADDGHRGGFDRNGWLAVSRIVFSDNAAAPSAERNETFGVIKGAALNAIAAWRAGAPTDTELINSLLRSGLLDFVSTNAVLGKTNAEIASKMLAARSSRLHSLIEEFRRIEETLPDPTRVPALAEGTGLDEAVFIRGSHKTPGEVVPRRFLEALGGSAEKRFMDGSGRLELAQGLTDPANPLFARVVVNRVWLHLFGRGIVPTPDDFGFLGQAPTHPELLDWLADWFRTEAGWSIKKLVRLLVMSSAYHMSGQPGDATAEESDPQNLLFHRMPVRRLEGEAIRDAILAISGRLDSTMFGTPVPIHLTEFMEGRGRPLTSGPLDGAGRRSIYIEVRRNFLSPMMRAFDTPVPFTTVGKRTISNVPAQSLILMNDPFVVNEAKRWAQKVLANKTQSPRERINGMYVSAFARPALESEIDHSLEFLQQQAKTHGLADEPWLDDERVWADLCHVLFNVKEFIFIN